MATFTPTNGVSYCDIDVGSFSNTIDNNTATRVGFRRYKDCVLEWTWDIPIDVNHFDVHSNNYGYSYDNYVHSILARINGSWERLWSGTLQLDEGQWTNIYGANCQNCTGIRLGVLHNDDTMAYINEVRVDYVELLCINPDGSEGQMDECGVGYGNQPDATHKYECVFGQWVDQGYNPDCVAGCTEGDREILEYCPDGVSVKRERICENGIWVYYNYDCPACTEGDIEILEYCPDGTTIKRERICENGIWVYYNYDCPNGNGNGDCEGLSETECKTTTGCFWYQKYLWEEPKCHGTEQNMMMDYLPFIAVGGGGLLLLLALVLPSKSAAYHPPSYYPPPPSYYPPPPSYPPYRR